MRARTCFLAAALAIVAASANADAIFRFEVHGSGLFAAGGTQGCSPFNPDQCIHAVDWSGGLTVQTRSGADGTYGIGGVVDNEWVPGGIVRVTLVSNVGDTDVDAQAFPGAQFNPDAYPYVVTIVDGRVSSIEWTSTNTPYEYPENIDGALGINGFDVTYLSNTYHGPFADVRGTLTAVPEPAGLSLSLLGLVGVALARRWHRTAPAALSAL